MKRGLKSSLTGFLAVSFFLLLLGSNGNRAMCQAKFDPETKTYVSLGIGVLDILHAGVGFAKHNHQGGIRVGSFPVSEKLFSFSADYYYHFAGYSEKASWKTWFGRLGIQYYSETGETYYDKMTFLNPRIGRKFFFSGRAGLEMDLGVMILLDHQKYYEKNPFFSFDPSVFPGLSLSFFYWF